MTRVRGRAAARHLALDVLAMKLRWQGKLEQGLRTPRISLPYLHAIPEGREETFRRLLQKLSETHTFIGYDEAMGRLAGGQIDRPYVSFSFDDGFKSNVRAAKILEEFGTTGCFFVPTGFIGTRTVQEAQAFFGYSLGVDEPSMSWEDLELLKSRGHLVENHTTNHRVLSWIPPSQYRDEIGAAAEVLRRHLGQSKHFAWPRGRFSHFTPAAASVVFETGHETCASAERGSHVAPHVGSKESLCVRRDHLMAEWPLQHQLYFLANSALTASAADNQWPASWPPEKESS